MKKSLVLLAGASLAFLGLPAVSHAQAASGPFADVPTDHWAYQSVDTLQKAGIVIGYPDGTYGGRRPMTRYEFAVAIARLLAQIKPSTNGVSSADLEALRTDLQNRIAGNTAAIDALRTLVNGFQPELTRLGQDVAAANARLDALEARVNALSHRLDGDEGILGSVVDEQRRFRVTGEVNLIAEAVASRRKADGAGFQPYLPFMTKNGTYQTLGNLGNGDTGNGAVFGAGPLYTNRLLQASSVYHDVLLHLRGRLSDTATANVDLDFGNYLSAIGNTANFGGLSGITPGGSTNGSFSSGTGGGSGGQYANVYKAYLDAAIKLGPLGGAELLIGRIPVQYTRYTLKLADADIYTNLTQTDSGDVIGDGGLIKFKAGPAIINGFAAKLNTPFQQVYGGSSGSLLQTGGGAPGNPFNPPTAGVYSNRQFRPGGLIAANHAAPLEQGAGVRATFGTPETAVVGLTLEQFGMTNNGQNGLGPNDGLTDPNRTQYPTGLGQRNGQYNRLTVYGADFNGALPFGLPGVKKGGILVDAAYTVSAHAFNQGFNNIGNGFRYASTDDQIGFAVGPVQLKGGYQYIGPEFSAPGYWGKLGAWTNPTNVRGPVVSAKYAFTPKLSLNADYETYTAAYGTNSDGTPINSPLHGAVDYTRPNGSKGHGGADHVNRYQIGLGYGLSSTYGVDLGYEAVQYDLRNQNGNSLANPVTGAQTSGRPTENYTTIGLGHTIGNNASIKLLYQIVHYDDKGTGFDSFSAPTSGKSDGSVAAAQFQLKF